MQATLVDGLGQLHTRVYASVGALPTPFLGAMAIVDGGTGGQLFVSLHDGSGTLAWIALADLYDVVQTVATPTNNEITSSDPTAAGLSVNVAGPALTLVSPQTDILAVQSGTTPTQVPVSVVRGTSTPGVALLETEPDGSTVVPFVNGSGEIVVRTYSSLPGASADHLGAIIRVLGGSGVEDKFYLCVLDATDTPIWTQFIGPTGATGAAGAPGVTPELRESGGYIQVSYDDGVTWSNLVPLTDITGPAGPAGSINFPALPDPGGAAVSFWISVLSTGQYLPWLIPGGYTIQVIGSSGLWGAVQFGDSDFISDGLGNNDGATWPTPHDSRFATGRIVAQLFDHTGALYAPDGTHNFSDPWTVLTLEEDSYVAFLENVSTGSLAAQISVLLTVTPAASGTWSSHIDFTSSDGGFAAAIEAGSPFGTYISGTGWEAAGVMSGGFPYKGVFITLTIDSTTLVSIEMFGTATFSNSNPSNAMLGAGGSSFLSYDTGATAPPSGAIDYLWDGVTSHASNPSSPQSTQTQLQLFLYASDHDETSGASLITGVTIHGTGTKPSQLP